jgi:hypothetical protein
LRRIGPLVALASLFLAAAAGDAAGQGGPALPKPDMCTQIATLMRGAGAPRGFALMSAIPGRRQLEGFSVEVPAGSWCEAAGSRADRVVFVRNEFVGELLSPAPPAARLRHTLFVVAFLILNDDRTPFTRESVVRMLNGCVDGPCPRPLPQPAERRIGAAECQMVGGRIAGSPDTIDQRHVACIHPHDPRFVVKLLIAESFPTGHPFYDPPLMTRAEQAIQGFVDSLRFTPM